MSPELVIAFGGEVTAIALLWRLTRGDGVVLGFTGHDQDILAGGVLYRAHPGMTPSAVALSDGFSADTMEVRGAMAAMALRADDLDVGRWDGARLELFACDWTDAEKGMLRLMRGTVGDVAREDFGTGAGFAVELESEMAALERGGAPLCSPLCRAELGDARCQVDMEGRVVEVGAVDGLAEHVWLTQPLSTPELYNDGRMRILDGPLSGIDRRIAVSSAGELLLEEPIHGDGLAGARIRLREGCDKRFATCAGRFANGAAFDGEPHVPGNDALIRYGES
ncbi:MAG: DUF2163 domain-containing protein [Sphingomonadaceae bacterium]